MAVKAEKSAANLISLFGTQPEIEEDEVPVGVALPANAASLAVAPAPSNLVDLTEKPKVWLTIGRGKTGKTTLIRFLVEETIGAGRQVVIADVDRTNATLTSYFEGVQRPPEGDESSVSTWLERLLSFIMAQRLSAYIDLGGGDTTLRRLVAEVSDLVAMLEAAGLAVVAAYLLGPQTDDLSPLATLEKAGFRPAATALVLNEGLIEASLPREEAFARVLRHSAFREAMARGAVALWMPRLLPAGEIEARRVLFGQAAAGITRDGRKQSPLGPFDRGRTRGWLDKMRAELAPVQSWMA
jgi:hypothetical protein